MTRSHNLNVVMAKPDHVIDFGYALVFRRCHFCTKIYWRSRSTVFSPGRQDGGGWRFEFVMESRKHLLAVLAEAEHRTRCPMGLRQMSADG